MMVLPMDRRRLAVAVLLDEAIHRAAFLEAKGGRDSPEILIERLAYQYILILLSHGGVGLQAYDGLGGQLERAFGQRPGRCGNDLLRMMGYQQGAFALGYVGDQQDPLAILRGTDENARLLSEFAPKSDAFRTFVDELPDSGPGQTNA